MRQLFRRGSPVSERLITAAADRRNALSTAERRASEELADLTLTLQSQRDEQAARRSLVADAEKEKAAAEAAEAPDQALVARLSARSDRAVADLRAVSAEVARSTDRLPGLEVRTKAAKRDLDEAQRDLDAVQGRGPGGRHETGLRALLAAEGQGLPFLGFRIFKWLLLLSALFVLVLVLMGWRTYPDVSLYLPTSPTSPSTPTVYSSQQVTAWETAKSSWWSSMKDGLQLLLLTPVFPLIGAVIGYIFGRDRPKGDHQ